MSQDSSTREDVSLRVPARKAVGSDTSKGSSLAAYLKQLEAYPELEPEQQQLLAVNVSELIAKQKKLVSRGKTLSSRELRTLESGKSQLVASIFRLAVKICRERLEHRWGREKATSMLPDVIGEANIAIADAINTYSPSSGTPFSGFAARKIRDHVGAHIQFSSETKLPASWLRVKRIAVVRIPELNERLGRQATTEEIQADLTIAARAWAESRLVAKGSKTKGKERQEEIDRILSKQGTTGAIRDINQVLSATAQSARLDAPVQGTEEAVTLGDTLADDRNDSAFDTLELGELREAIMHALSSLPERDREIVMYRYGFIDGTTPTYPAIAEKYGISAERVRQLERKILAELSSTPGLESFLR